MDLTGVTPERTTSRLPRLLVLGALAVAVAIVLSRAAVLLVLPLQLNFVEGYNAAIAERFAESGILYSDPTTAPWLVTPYTPFYFVLTALMTLLGPAPLLAGRVVAASSALGIALVVVWAGWRRTGWIAAALGLGFLTAPVVQQWLPVARPDFTAVLLSCLGVAVADRWQGRTAALWAAPLVAASVLTKQTQIAALVAVSLGALLHDPRRGWRVGALSVGLTALGVAGLQLSSGGAFWWHTVTANVNPFSWARALAIASRFLVAHVPELVVLVAMLCITVAGRRLTACWLFAALSVPAVATIGKVGSDTNYFIELLAATALLGACELPLERLARPGLAAGVLVLAAIGTAGFRGYHAWQTPAPTDATVRAYLAAADFLRAAPGDVVSDDAALLRLAGRPILFEPFAMTQAALNGHWDERPFLAALKEGTITYVIAELEPEIFASRYTPAMRQVIDSEFSGVATLRCGFEYTVLRRRKHDAGD